MAARHGAAEEEGASTGVQAAVTPHSAAPRSHTCLCGYTGVRRPRYDDGAAAGESPPTNPRLAPF